MTTQSARHAITAVRAFELAGITYRQLDYWARREWVAPSIEAGTGRPGRRLYSAEDVLRLGLLGHLGRSGADIGQLGPRVAKLKLPAGDFLVVLGPDQTLEVMAATQLRSHLATPGSYIVFDPGPLRHRLGLGPATAGANRLNQARSA